MTSANIQILKNETTGKYRFLMVDSTGYCIVSQDRKFSASQVLGEDFGLTIPSR